MQFPVGLRYLPSVLLQFELHTTEVTECNGDRHRRGV